MLISSPHLARSYHHLFPVPPFEEVPLQDLPAAAAAAAAAAPGRGSVDWYEPGQQQQQQQQQKAGSSRRAPAGGSNGSSSGSEGGGGGGGVYCYGCLRGLEAQQRGGAAAAGAQVNLVLRCGQCRQLFCFECDAFIHESLHNCPGCECCAGQQTAAAGAENGTTTGAAAAGGGANGHVTS